MKQYYIGLMSGTSIDSMDGVLLEITGQDLKLLGQASLPWDEDTKKELHRLCRSGPDEMDQAGRSGCRIAEKSAEVVKLLLRRCQISSDNITALGSHGQTVRHRPEHGFSIQLDNPAYLACLTGIDVIANFRAADLAASGQGAPLTPIFHKEVFGSDKELRFILNIGGICNLTVLDGYKIIAGYDTGPGNTLIDLTCRTFFNQAFDKDGRKASEGTVKKEVLNKLLEHPYFAQKAPKSTGREIFNEDYLGPCFDMVAEGLLTPQDLTASLTALTVRTAGEEILFWHNKHGSDKPSRLILCGGGTFNPVLKKGLENFLNHMEDPSPKIAISTSSEFGIGEQYLEAQAFAFFASLFVRRKQVFLEDITGSSGPVIMGQLSPAPKGAFVRGLY